MLRGGPGAIPDEVWRTLQVWESSIDAQVEQLAHEQIAIRRHLHAHPEPSGEETQTACYIRQRLSTAGLDARLLRNDRGLETGVVADLALGQPPADAPLIALRADIDALRVPDEKTVEYRSLRSDVAHACGHDAHTSVVLGAALAGAGVDRNGGEFPAGSGARLRFLFQPAEETSEGARWLVAQGAMEGVDAVLGLHVDPERACGEVGIRYGVLTANCDEVHFLVEGHGGHAARPHHSTDPVAAAAYLVTALYGLLPRSVDSRNASVLTIGRIAGGYAPNVIPERVELQGTLRTTDDATRGRLLERIAEVCRGVQETSGVTITPQFLRPLGAVYNHPAIAAALEAASRRLLDPAQIILLDRPSMGGEDFSVYLDHAPGAMLRLGCAAPGAKPPFLHSSTFDLDERALALGTRVLLRAALLLTRTAAEWKRLSGAGGQALR
jgi:amidohydrolase